jgi:predicted house-cleaning NTP pyrophosphatase (Maf/HAM1 superfamily)
MVSNTPSPKRNPRSAMDMLASCSGRMVSFIATYCIEKKSKNTVFQKVGAFFY